MHALWIACLSLLLALPGGAARAGVVKTEHVTAELVASASAVQPGQTVQIGLLLQHIPHWHTYWRNPGDSGLPTTLSWTLPDGSRIGDIQWPAPKRLPIGPLVNYGYEGELLLPMAFTAPADARPGSELLLKARADWLVCKDVCIPEGATLELRLPVVAAGITPGSTAATALFERALAEQAVPLAVANAGWSAALRQSGRDLLLTVESSDKAPSAVPALHVFPFVEQLIDPAVHQLYRTPRGYAVKLLLMPDAQPPAELKGVAVAQGDNTQPWGGTRRMVEFSAPWQVVPKLVLPDGALRMDGAAAARATGVASMAGTSIGVWSALLMAFIGGMVLNLMPCVFPVLSIKLLSLTQQAQPPAALRAQALAYGGGVLGSFLVLATALIALQAAGSAVGWGFQLQEPGVVFVLAVLFFAIGLNLIGAFDFSQVVPHRLVQWRAKRPAGDAFACGVLAVVAASPCTAPFMGAALGYALTQSPAMALGVFAALGLGMAVPFMLLTLMPGWRKHLPKPGAWMLHLKQGLAFPMFATAVWLLWVLGQQAGVSAMARLLMAVVGLGLVLWLAHVRLARGPVGRIAGLAAVLALLAWSWPATLPADAPSPATSSAGEAGEAVWQPYDRQTLDRFVAAGQPVFVDFTAAWCVGCQVNKRLVLNVKETQAAFDESKVVLMRADWTRRDAAITEALAALGRNGVPVYALYRPGRDTLLLPEVLTFGTVREALATLQP